MRRRGLGPARYHRTGALGAMIVGGVPVVTAPGGSTVTGMGTGLGPLSPSVTVNGHPATVLSHTPYSVTFTLPAFSGTGMVVVSAGGIVMATYPAFTTTVTPLAARFTASASQYLSAADSASMDFTGDMAAAAWINPTALTGAYREIIAKGDDSAASTYEWGIRSTAANLWEFLFASGNNFFVADGAAVVPGTWTFVYVEFDSASKFAAIKTNNGTAVSAGTGGGLLNQTAQPLTLGTAANTASFFDGEIGFVGFWNRKLTASEQTSLFGLGDAVLFAALAGTLLTNLQLCYDMSPDLSDRTANGNTLTNHNAVTQVPRP